MDGVRIELFVDVVCPYSLLALRRVRDAMGEFEGACRLSLRTLPLVPDLDRLVQRLGSPEAVRELFAKRLDEAARLVGGDNFATSARALRDGRLDVPCSLVSLAAVKWADARSATTAVRLFGALASRLLESGGALEPSDVVQVAAELRLPGGDLALALAEGALGEAIARDKVLATRLRVQATPAALLDASVRLDGLLPTDEYREAIAQRLKARRRAPPEAR